MQLNKMKKVMNMRGAERKLKKQVLGNARAELKSDGGMKQKLQNLRDKPTAKIREASEGEFKAQLQNLRKEEPASARPALVNATTLPARDKVGDRENVAQARPALVKPDRVKRPMPVAGSGNIARRPKRPMGKAIRRKAY